MLHSSTEEHPPLIDSPPSKTSRNQSALNQRRIAHIKLGEAGFVTANDKIYLIGTKINTFSILVGGYDPTNKIAFVAQLVFEQGVTFLRSSLIAHIRLLRKIKLSPLFAYS